MTTEVWTDEANTALVEYLGTHNIAHGLGTEESACSVAAINLALTGKVNDEVPACMSEVIGNLITHIQDAMPRALRNSLEWKTLLPVAAGTGRDEDTEGRRFEVALEWMWDTVLPSLMPIVEKHGLDADWNQMLLNQDKTSTEDAEDSALLLTDIVETDFDEDQLYNAGQVAEQVRIAMTFATDYRFHDAGGAIGHAASLSATMLRAHLLGDITQTLDNRADLATWTAYNPTALLKALIEA